MVSPRLASLAIAVAVALPTGHAAAAERFAIPDVAVQLLDGGSEDDGRRLAGVEIRIDTGWKTYWRHPGDAGLAPSFDFSGSTNVADVEVEWPAPSLSHDGFGWVIGYEREVVFPLVVTPQDPARPVELVLDLDYAVCAEICIPLEAADVRRLDDAGADRAVIDFYRDLVPETVGEADDLGVVEVREVASPEGSVIEFIVATPGAGAEPQLIVEGPAAWLFAVPELTGRTPDGAATFRVPVTAVLPQDNPTAAELLVTGLAPGFAFRQVVPAP